ncbi:MAG: hypothetical protein WCW35_04940 [Bacteroidota bacterium]
MWKSLEFKQSPYDSSPLRPTAEDVDLLVGRQTDAAAFITHLESKRNGVFIISGPPGVGKTSFLNTQLFLLETSQAYFGPKIMAPRKLCPVQPDDTPRDVALRALRSLSDSIELYCQTINADVPKQTKDIIKWLAHQGSSGFELGLQVMGFGGSLGRQFSVPSVSDVSFEHIQDVITCVVDEVIKQFDFKSLVIVLDNVENLEDDTLTKMLMTFRDTLFTIPDLWWVLIGQSGLSSLIQSIDPRVAQRMSGTGLELKPIPLNQLNAAIDKRVTRFHLSGTGKAPLPAAIHKYLYEASHGELRFVLKYSESICINIVQNIRSNVISKGTMTADNKPIFDKAIGNLLKQGVIPESAAIIALKEIVKSELDGFNLKPKELQVLKSIAEKGGARAKDHQIHGVKIMQDFSGNYLSKLYRQHLLIRQQEGRSVYYKVAGISSLAAEFNLYVMKKV